MLIYNIYKSCTVSYSTLVTVMEAKNITPKNQPHISYSQYWLGIDKPENAFRSALPFQKVVMQCLKSPI